MGEQCGTLTLAEVAEITRLSKSTIQRRVRAGLIPTLPKEPRQALRFPAAAIRRMVDEGRVAS